MCRHGPVNRCVPLFPPSLPWVPALPVPHAQRYYGGIRLLPRPFHVDSGLPCHAVPRRTPRRRGGLPGSWGIPLKACPGLGTPTVRVRPRLTLAPIRPSARLTTSAPTRRIDFGAESSRPASSLCTLHLTGNPMQVQHALPACPLRLWPGWTSTSWIPLRGFIYSCINPPLPGFGLAL